MRKLTELKKPILIDNPTKKHHTEPIASYLPLEMCNILSKYNKQFANILNDDTNSFEYHYRNATKFYLQYDHFYSENEFNIILAQYPNLKTCKLINLDSFNFVFVLNSKVKKTKFVNIKNFVIDHTNFNIKKLSFKNCFLTKKNIKKLLELPYLYKFKLNKCKFDCDTEELFKIIKKFKNVKSLTYKGDFAEDQIKNFNLNLYDAFNFTTNNFKLICNKSSILKNKLYIQNYDFLNTNIDLNEIYNIKIRHKIDISKHLSFFQYASVIDLSGCIFSDEAFIDFLDSQKEMIKINISKTFVNLRCIEKIIFNFKNSLLYLNIAEIQISGYILQYAKDSLKNCILIYNDNIKIHIK